jgi:hypothetical protein
VTTRGVGPTVLKYQLIQIVDAFSRFRLPYMVIGAFALSAWGRPRATLDLDFILQTTEIPADLVGMLSGLSFVFDEEWDRYNRMIRGFHKRFRSGRTAVDLLLIRDAHDAAAFSRRKRKRFNGKYIWFPSAEDLLVQKLKVGRPQDFIDAGGIVERMRTKLDRRYLNKWARKLGLMAQLEHVLSRK